MICFLLLLSACFFLSIKFNVTFLSLDRKTHDVDCIKMDGLCEVNKLFGRSHSTALKVGILAAFLFHLPSIKAAESNITEVSEEPIEVIYALGYPNDQLVAEPNLSTTIISREQLASYGSASLTQVLSDVSGIFVDQNGGRGSFNSVFLRGADPNFTQIRINGIVVNDATNTRGGAFDLGSLSALTIERIDIIRDASSALYGSQALAGVINIVTRQAESGVEAAIGFDSHGGYTSSVMLANEALSLALTSERPNSSIDGSLYESDQLDLNGHWLFSDRHELRFNTRVQDNVSEAFPDDSGGALFSVNRELERRQSVFAQLGVHYLHTLSSGGKLEVNTSVFSSEEQRLTPAVFPGVRDPFGFPQVESDTEYRRTLAELRYLGVDNKRWNWLLGLSWEREEGEQVGELDFSQFVLPSDFSLERDTISTSALINGQLSDNLKISFGGRLERIDDETVFSPRVSAEYTIGATQTLFASWGEGFKSASFFALGDPFIGSPDLNDELAKSIEFSHRWVNDFWQVRHTVFSTEFTDLIDFESGPPPTLLNRSRVRNQGLESAVELTINEQWVIDLNQTYVSTEAPTTLRQRPRYRAHLAVNYAASDDVSIWFRGQRTSKRFDSSIATGDLFLQSFNSFDIGAQWRLQSRWTLTANLQNLLNGSYQQSVGNVRDDTSVSIQLQYSTN